MYLKCMMHNANIYTIWYIECNSSFDQIGIVFSDAVFLKDILIGLPWKTFHRCFMWDVFV